MDVFEIMKREGMPFRLFRRTAPQSTSAEQLRPAMNAMTRDQAKLAIIAGLCVVLILAGSMWALAPGLRALFARRAADRAAYWAAIERQAAADTSERKQKSEAMIDWCLARDGTANTDNHGHFTGCTIPPQKQK